MKSAALLLILAFVPLRMVAQAPDTAGSNDDPLIAGKDALNKDDYTAAQNFFTDYAAHHPASIEATLYAGTSSLLLKQYPLALEEFKKVAKATPKAPEIHNDLAMTYAGIWAIGCHSKKSAPLQKD